MNFSFDYLPRIRFELEPNYPLGDELLINNNKRKVTIII